MQSSRAGKIKRNLGTNKHCIYVPVASFAGPPPGKQGLRCRFLGFLKEIKGNRRKNQPGSFHVPVCCMSAVRGAAKCSILLQAQDECLQQGMAAPPHPPTHSGGVGGIPISGGGRGGPVETVTYMSFVVALVQRPDRAQASIESYQPSNFN